MTGYNLNIANSAGHPYFIPQGIMESVKVRLDINVEEFNLGNFNSETDPRKKITEIFKNCH